MPGARLADHGLPAAGSSAAAGDPRGCRRATETPPGEIATAIDGCGVVTFALPLERMARAFARLDGLDGGALLQAMRARPELVARPARSGYASNSGGAGGWAAKLGAEGLLCAVADDGRLALKCEDGELRAVGPALGRFLELLGRRRARSVDAAGEQPRRDHRRDRRLGVGSSRRSGSPRRSAARPGGSSGRRYRSHGRRWLRLVFRGESSSRAATSGTAGRAPPSPRTRPRPIAGARCRISRSRSTTRWRPPRPAGCTSSAVTRPTAAAAERLALRRRGLAGLAPMPSARAAAGAAVVGTKLYVAGGVTSDALGGRTLARRMLVFDLARSRWSSVAGRRRASTSR